MEALDKKHRKQLEHTIITARNVAEMAARTALERLCVGDNKPGEHLSDKMRQQRNKLRAHGRQLGDIRQANGEQGICHLINETAYEQWHRMLFARFLAENNLLIYKEDGVTPLSIQECFELAEDEDNTSGWDLAGEYASVMLPQIFRTENPVLTITFSPEHQHGLEQLLEALPVETFLAQDSLGWVYQYWQTQKKEAVNKSGNKIGADELPAVTQLFTEAYMVSFLLDNSLGAWWVTHYPQYKDVLPLEYLRYAPEQNDDEESEYKETDIPAAGTFEGWPKHLSELKMLDPCCGSGHFLVATFLMLVPMRMKVEGLTADKAIEYVLSQNIHGLELDQRCVEIAAFAVALEAWRYPESSGYRPLPSFNIAWVGQSIKAKKQDWLSLAGDDKNLYHGMDALYETFKDAPILGSLIDPSKAATDNLFDGNFSLLMPLLNQALKQYEANEKQETIITARGLSLAVKILESDFTLVASNPPYLTSIKQEKTLKKYSKIIYPDSQKDLATMFIDKYTANYGNKNGSVALVTPQNWLFLIGYKKLREKLFTQSSINIISILGTNSFLSSQAAGANVGMFVISNISPDKSFNINIMDASDCMSVDEKEKFIKNKKVQSINQLGQLKNIQSRFMINTKKVNKYLFDYAVSKLGVVTGDSDKWKRNFWEVNKLTIHWTYCQSTTSNSIPFGGKEYIIDWSTGGDGMHRPGIGNPSWKHNGVAVSQMGSLPVSLYSGEKYDNNTAAITPIDNKNLLPLVAFLFSPDFHSHVRDIDGSKKVNNATLLKIPFELEYWDGIAKKKYPNGLPKPYSNDPTQWIFHGHPAHSEAPLQVAIVRLLGYQWPAETDKTMELSEQARVLIKQCQPLASHTDDDGIVCIPPIRGEQSADERLEALLLDAYGSDWNTAGRNKLLEEAKCKGKSLAFWLRDKFFEQHCKLFHNRPFIWQIWDGLSDGFSALVNYHQLDKKNLERLIYTYLGDWIKTQEHGVKEGFDGATIRLQAAQTLKNHLETILEGEAPYDIFIRWKPLSEQAIGWNPDINDGIRLNIRPFMSVPDIGKKKGAGILRTKPNIHWKKDRGKDVESAPWYQLGLEYGESEGARINNHHLSLVEKEDARNG